MMRATTCGVIVTDGEQLVLGRVTGTSRWDIPKGGQAPGESFLITAIRELYEETGLVASPSQLIELGPLCYRPEKDLILFLWHVDQLPNPKKLKCGSHCSDRSGKTIPEFDKFRLAGWDELSHRLPKRLAVIVDAISKSPLVKRPRVPVPMVA
jgi:8-oxo-dGTP pyrophosphatase MutT (NUDIX family)